MKTLKSSIQHGHLIFDINQLCVDKSLTDNNSILDTGKLMDIVSNLVEETLKHPFLNNKFENDEHLLKNVKGIIIDVLKNTGRCVVCNTITSRKKDGTDINVCIDCSH